MQSLATTAILIFSRTKAEEAEVKTFSHNLGKIGNQKIADLLIKKTIATAQKTGLPVFTSFTYQQIGNSFGEKLANSMADIFQKGYENVIVIGNDCPNLSTERLLETHHLFSEREIILGPAEDGGLYLLGMQKHIFEQIELENFAWESATLTSDWQDYISQKNQEAAWLVIENDIDSAKDLAQYLAQSSPLSHFAKKINNILTGILSSVFFYKNSFKLLSFFSNLPLRAPPIPHKSF